MSAGPKLTKREREVVEHVVRGLRNKQIAASLGIGESTVKMMLHNIFRKIGIDNRTALAMWARDRSPSP